MSDHVEDGGAAGCTLMDRWHQFRVRMVANPRFQKWAASFPLTRWVARRRARSLFDLCAGFVYTQVLYAVVRLDLIGTLSDGPLPAPLLAQRVGLDEAAGRRLFAAAASLDLLSDRGNDVYGLGDLGAAILGNAGVGEMVLHHATLYADLRDPVALLRGEGRTALSTYWSYTDRDAPDLGGHEKASDYSALMASSQPMIVEDVLDAYPVDRHNRLLDVGGGTGGFALAAAGRAPDLHVHVVDLPTVTEIARQRFDDAGLGDRAEATGLDFHKEALPKGADLISLIRVCFDHPDEQVVRLLSSARTALASGGRLLIAEPMADQQAADPVADAYFGFYLLAMGGGRCRTPDALTDLLGRAGFSRVERRRLRRPMLAGLLVARAD